MQAQVAEIFIPEWLRIKERRSAEITEHNHRMWANPVMRQRFIEARRLAWARGKYDEQRYRRNTGKHSRHFARMLALRKQGLTYKAIASRFGCSETTVWRCARAGRAVPHQLYSITAEKVQRLRAKHWTYSRIARVFGCSIATVRRRMARVQGGG